MIILDTNVLSALMQPERNPQVVAWLDGQPRTSVWTTSVSVMETRFGIELLPDGHRKTRLGSDFAALVSEILSARIVPLDTAAAEIAGTLAATRRKAGLNVDIQDTQIAAIALSRNATLATRNKRRFQDTGLTLVNPWVG